MKPIKIDLNNYDIVKTEEELEGYSSLIIIPNKMVDGTQPPVLYFRRGEPKVPLITDITNAIWYKDCSIDNKGCEKEYSKRVDWWFSNAINDEEYKTIINDTYNCNGFDVKMSWEKAKAWLKSQLGSSRKTYIHKFIWNWLSKGMRWQLNRLERNK